MANTRSSSGWFDPKSLRTHEQQLPDFVYPGDVEPNGLLFNEEQIKYAIKLAESNYKRLLEESISEGIAPTPDRPLASHISRKFPFEIEEGEDGEEVIKPLTGEQLAAYQAASLEERKLKFPLVMDSTTKLTHSIEVTFNTKGEVSKMWVPYYGEQGHPAGRPNNTSVGSHERVQSAVIQTVNTGNSAKAVLAQCVYNPKDPETVGKWDIFLKQRKEPQETSAKFLKDAAKPVTIYCVLKEKDPEAAEHFKERTCFPGDIFEEQYGAKRDRSAVVLPYMQGGDLFEALKSNSSSWSFEQRLQMAIDIAEAVAYIHQAGWVHFDIKPENVLLDEKGRAYLADFGHACTIQEAIKKRLYGTPELTDLQLFDTLRKKQAVDTAACARAADIYGLGGTLWPLLGLSWDEVNSMGDDSTKRPGAITLKDRAQQQWGISDKDINCHTKNWMGQVNPALLERAQQLIYKMTCVYQAQNAPGERGRYDEMAPILEELRSIQSALREQQSQVSSADLKRYYTSSNLSSLSDSGGGSSRRSDSDGDGGSDSNSPKPRRQTL